MTIDPPLPGDTRSKLADWLEVRAILQPRRRVTYGDLYSLWDIMEDESHALEIDNEVGEKLETEILDDRLTRYAEDVIDEIDWRAEILGSDYPFQITAFHGRWSVTFANPTQDTRVDVARTCYLFCLLASVVRDGRIDGLAVAELGKSLSRIFQALSVEAAAGFLNGRAYSFGWPRPDNSRFILALSEACRKMGIGRPVETQPLFASGQEKDAGIDVIAWRDFRDGRPSKALMLAQVASGRNWKSKSVKNDIDQFMSWFAKQPARHIIPALLIPFPLHHEIESRADASFDDVAADKIWHLEMGFGLVLDRFRIVETAAGRLAEGGTLPLLRQWTDDALAAAQAPI